MATDFREFDRIKITNAASARWLYTDHGSLGGVWTVVSVRGDELIASRDDLLIRIRSADVAKVAAYDISSIACISKAGSPYRGKEGQRRGGSERRTAQGQK